MKNTAINAAYQAGNVLQKYYTKKLTVSTKANPFDLVTQADVEAERAIVNAIKAKFPDHAFWTEESGQSGASDYVWLIDPLDGTTNFVHHYPMFSVTVSLLYQRAVILSVIYDPIHNELFVAEKGAGASLNNNPIHVSNVKTITGALVATGFASARGPLLKRNLAYFQKVLPVTQGIRRSGSAALNMAHVACGRLDGYWVLRLAPWDWVGGALLVEEAGGRVSDISGSPWNLETKEILVANPAIHQVLRDMLE